MNEIKTDLFPERLRAGKKEKEAQKNVVPPAEPLPEPPGPGKGGPGGE